MNDVALWRLLGEPASAADPLARLLEAGAALSLAERRPFLSRALDATAHAAPAVRAAAARFLAGAGGASTFRALVALFADDAPAVRVAAVHALAISAGGDAARWAHAFFHPDALVRRTALAAGPPHGVVPALWLLADPELRPLVLPLLPLMRWNASTLPALLEVHRAGLLDSATTQDCAAQALRHGPPAWLYRWCPDDVALAILKAGAAGRAAIAAAATAPPGVLGALIDLGWASPRAAHAPLMLSTAHRFAGSRACKATRGPEPDARQRYAAALLAATARHDGPEPAWAVDALVPLVPQALAFDWLNAPKRRGAACAVLDDPAFAEPLEDAEAAALVRAPLCWREPGALDLPVAGAVACCRHGGAPLTWLVADVGETAVIEAFEAAPLESAPLLRANDNGRGWLIEALRTRARGEPGVAVVLLAALPANALGFLARLDGRAALMLLSFYLDDRGAASALNARTVHVAAGHLAHALTGGHAADFLRMWLAEPDPEAFALGLRVLGELATCAAPPDFGALALSLDPEPLRALLTVVDHCAGFPHAADQRLAQALDGHADAAVARWATTKLVLGLAPRVPLEHTGGEGPLLKEAQAKRIELGPAADLAAALAPAFARPVRGLAAALAGRRPAFASAAACAALIGCHDPLDEVAAELARYGANDRAFLDEVDGLVARAFQGARPASTATQAWLACWERHAFALAAVHMTDAGALGRLLDTACWLAWEPLGDALWTAVRHVLAAWRWRDTIRFGDMMTGAIIARFAGQLPGRREVTAAAVLGLVHAAGHAARLEPVRAQVRAALADVSEHTRGHLAGWLDARGLAGGPPPPRAVARRADGDLARRIATLGDVDALAEHCASGDVALVTEASLRLLELGEAARLAALLGRRPPVPAVAVLAESVALWPEGAALASARDLARAADTEPCLRFLLAVVLMERGELAHTADALAAACAPSEAHWFRQEDYLRLRAVALSKRQVALGLATSPHPRAYECAVTLLLDCSAPGEAELAAVRAFLECGTERLASLRLEAARWLGALADPCGLHLVVGELLSEDGPSAGELLGRRPELARELVECALADPGGAELRALEALRGAPEDARVPALERLVAGTADGAVRALALQRLDRAERRSARARAVAQAFGWVVLRGRELTGRLLRVRMIHGEDNLGWTVPGDRVLHVNPLPLLRAERGGRAIVEGLGLHEVGHQLYHAGPEADAVRIIAAQERIGGLLNLVADEHLERNLAARADSFRERFRALAAWAFQHAAREMQWPTVLAALGARAFAVLAAAPPEVARQAGCVRLGARTLRELERAGSSFARFFRALRLGLGGRHGDPQVDAALALFGRGFRAADMRGLLAIARRLRDLFPLDLDVLEAFGQHELTEGDRAEVEAESEGLASAELEEEIERVVNPRRRTGSGGSSRRWINVGAAAAVNVIGRVVPLRYDAAEHRALAERVARPARAFRRFLADLGKRVERTPRRLRGRALDRAGLQRALVRRDPRLLEARRLVVRTDLFVGVAIDCSGSMQQGGNLERARLFGAMLAEAARGVAGVDLRLFGFTDSTIFEAGDARHPAVHALVAGGGNDDAAALLHVANVAQASRRRARLIVMISDGLPTSCSVETLRRLVADLTRRHGLALAQVAVRKLDEVCFPHHVVVDSDDLDASVRTFGGIVARLIRGAIARAG